MSERVVSIRGNPLPDPHKPVSTVCRAAQEMMERALSGDIQGAVVVVSYADGTFGYDIAGYVRGYGIMGALDVAKAKLLEEHADD